MCWTRSKGYFWTASKCIGDLDQKDAGPGPMGYQRTTMVLDEEDLEENYGELIAGLAQIC